MRVFRMLRHGAVSPSSPSFLRQVSHSTDHSRIPTEVCERIIDFLAGELVELFANTVAYNEIIRTLHACALVCHAWTIRSPLYLFEIIRIRCFQGSSYTDADAAAFLDRERYLQTRVTQIVAEGDYRTVTPIPFLNTFPLRLAKHLHRVTHSRFEGTVLLCAPVFFPTLRQFTMVTTLTLRWIVVQSISDLRQTIASFSGLQDLHVSYPRPPRAPAPASCRAHFHHARPDCSSYA